VGVALRRTAVTPTFAAGLGIVLAGVLALSTARTVIRYGGEPPAGGHPCSVQGCLPTGTGGGQPASVKPGSKLVTPVPVKTRSHGAAPAAAGPAPGGGNRTPRPGRPVVQYQTVHQWQGGFLEQVVISTGPGPAPASWELLLTYPGAQILHVWGARWVSENSHTALVEPGDPGGFTPDSGGILVYLAVTGSPGPPSGCSFDGRTCRTG
jgi:Cellulose binding domain